MNATDWRGPFCRRKQRRASKRGKRMANTRWANEARRREFLNRIDPVRVGGEIVERIVVIRFERFVKERTIYEFDRPCDVQRKRKEVFA